MTMTAMRAAFGLRSFLLLAGLVLAGCSGGQRETALEAEILRTVRDQIQLRLKDKPQRPQLTRAQLNTLDTPYIEVIIEQTDQFAYLQPQLVKQDTTPGAVTVWRTVDQVTLAMRNGVLIATRGMRNDMLSSSALVRESGGAMGPSGSGARRYEFAALDNRSQAFTLTCDVSDLGAETIEIVERSYRTRHLREQCEGESGVVVNDYWVDSQSGHLWQSRQWAGPTTGYLRIRQLTL